MCKNDVAIPVEKSNAMISDTERKALIKQASKAINKQYSEAFKMISKS